MNINFCHYFRFFGGFGFSFGSQDGNQRSETPKGAEVVMDLEVTLEELYTGEFVEVNIIYGSLQLIF